MFIAVLKAKVTQNILRGNEVGRSLGYGWGGGLIVVGKGNSAELSFNSVYANFAAAYGSGEFIDEGAKADIHHELIYRNVSKAGCEAVSAISVDGGEGVGSQATISHCTVVDNVCENATRGNGLQVESLSTVSVTNSVFWNNGGDDFATDGTSKLNVTYTCSQEVVPGTGNLSSDPLFVNEAVNDYHLAAGSPCINAGDPASPFDNETLPNGGRADMGRYGNATDTPAANGPNVDPTDTPSGGGSMDDAPPDGGNPVANGGGDGDGTVGPANEDSLAASGEKDAGGPALGAAVCPTASAMLLAIAFIGARLAPRRATACAGRS